MLAKDARYKDKQTRFCVRTILQMVARNEPQTHDMKQIKANSTFRAKTLRREVAYRGRVFDQKVEFSLSFQVVKKPIPFAYF